MTITDKPFRRFQEMKYIVKGPYYFGVLKDGTVRMFAKAPKRPHVEEYTQNVDFHGQHKWHFLTATNGKKIDFESVCGFDRGPRFAGVIRNMLK